MSGFGEMLVSTVVKEVMKKLGSTLWKEIGLHWGFKDDMNEMKENLEMIEAVLGDAERKSVTNKSVCLWLNKLKSAAYDIEDIMCSFETKIPSNNEGDGWVDKLRHVLISVPKDAAKRVALTNHMKNMRKRLDKIGKTRSDFGLTSGNNFDKAFMIKERETVSAFKGTMILGRDTDKEEMLSLLLQPDPEVSILAIVGLGGIGKTTLAQLLYNDESLKQDFDEQGWAYVSMEFDPTNIGKALLESFREKSQNIPSSLEGIRISLQETIIRKKYFIVLDDLWEEDGRKLEELKWMLRGGIQGSKIIVTTRSENVAARIRAAQSCKLKGLPDHYCWQLFSQRAFTTESKKNDKELVKIGREIVKKCGGIPLASISLGYTMQSKEGIEAWLEVRDSDIWRFDESNNSSFKTAILPSLKLSYYLMPSYLKLCFVYCSIFRKGENFSSEELIQQWISLGFIQPTDKGMSLEKCGEGYINDLLGMSFLQPFNTYDPEVLSMHDLARSVIGNEPLVLDAQRNDTDHVANVEPNYCYALLFNFNGLTNVSHTLLGKIRAIHCHDCTFSNNKMEFSTHTLLHAKYLRVLSLNGSYSSDLTSFPDSIGKLKQLRYLYADGVGLVELPESFGSLINLRYLYMPHNYFQKLPVSFGNLTNLQILMLDGCKKLEFLLEPLNLASLQQLSLENCVNLRKLPDSISNLTKLQILILDYCEKIKFLPEPFTLTSLQQLPLNNCVNLRKLPDSISNLTKLQILDISYCRNLCITPSFLCISTRLSSLSIYGSAYPNISFE